MNNKRALNCIAKPLVQLFAKQTLMKINTSAVQLLLTSCLNFSFIGHKLSHNFINLMSIKSNYKSNQLQEAHRAEQQTF